jgi:hypothetical protein
MKKNKWTKPMLFQRCCVVDENSEIAKKFKGKLLKDMIDSPPKFMKLANDNFWELF